MNPAVAIGTTPSPSLEARGARTARLGAWVVLGGFSIVVLACLLFGRAGMLRLGYPLAAVIVGALLFRIAPALYLGFTWWLWFLTPFVRRLVDYRIGWEPTSPVLLAPLLVTGLCGLSLLRHLPKLQRRSLQPFGLVLVAILGAFPLGVMHAGLPAATYGLLQWMAPIWFGFHLAVHWDRYPAYRRITQQAFAVGVLVIGLYGIWQYLSPRPWDTYWMISSQMTSIGQPQPRLIRVFSTMNSPPPFALTLLAGLILLLSTRAVVQWLAGVPGYTALLLSLVRTAWLGWFVGLVTYAMYLSHRARFRILAVAGVLALIMVPLLGREQFQEVIPARFASLKTPSQDLSYQARLAFYAGSIAEIVDHPMGLGLGTTGAATLLEEGGDQGTSQRTFDSGVLDVFRTLGWAGGAELFFGGTLLMLAGFARRSRALNDHFADAARAIAIAFAVSMLSFNSMVAGVGAVFWGFAGLLLAARRYADAPGHGPSHGRAAQRRMQVA
ncbi:MAG TPA: O-antigen ligase family protein [Gemmatimonadales bacterium]|nr:O-antigen ligase family protein [Gemmatimonadales bacterium]